MGEDHQTSTKVSNNSENMTNNSSDIPASITGSIPNKKPTLSKRPAFKPRTSRLDTETVNSEHFSLRGFFTAFWIALAVYSVNTVYRTWKAWENNNGNLRLPLFDNMFQDGVGLFVADCGLILSCFMSLVIIKLLLYKIIPLRLATIVQHAWQSFWLASCISLVFYKNWPWVQSGFFTLHSVAMLMKQHSYLSTNIEMERKSRKLHSLETEKKKSEIQQKKQDAEVTKEDYEAFEKEIKLLSSEMTTDETKYPANVTLMNFVDYMLVPTLVYDLQYPRTDKFRLSYFMEKLAGIFGAFFLMYITVEHYIVPVIQEVPSMQFIDIFMGLMMPFMVCYFMVFYIIFEGICNAFAELTLFADRDFYSDWWNSTTFDEFARKWNRPVHEFLLRHVYLESLETYKLSKESATFLTFFLSSCLHELVLAIIGKRIRFWLFGFQMLQIPLIYIARIPFIRKQKLLGNIVFWIGMLLVKFYIFGT